MVEQLVEHRPRYAEDVASITAYGIRLTFSGLLFFITLSRKDYLLTIEPYKALKAGEFQC